ISCLLVWSAVGRPPISSFTGITTSFCWRGNDLTPRETGRANFLVAPVAAEAGSTCLRRVVG
ncbi:hypothetical protein, partial [Bradyrhizobium sp.]|uniref:hypothetical protein n=1 Tax=Bradyrhizobium sp. TaxID=376 RepID=UPI00238EEFAE